MLNANSMSIEPDCDVSHPAAVVACTDDLARHNEALLDEALEASFPASDPVSSNLFN